MGRARNIAARSMNSSINRSTLPSVATSVSHFAVEDRSSKAYTFKGCYVTGRTKIQSRLCIKLEAACFNGI